MNLAFGFQASVIERRCMSLVKDLMGTGPVTGDLDRLDGYIADDNHVDAYAANGLRNIAHGLRKLADEIEQRADAVVGENYPVAAE